MSDPATPDPRRTPRVHPLVALLSRLWLVPRREVWKRFRLGRLRMERLEDLDLVVLPGVFDPVAFRTGKYFAGVLRRAELPPSASAALDLGCGTGVLGLVLARRGLAVDAVDVDPEAVRCARINALVNRLEDRVEAHAGDLFEPVAGKRYDLVTFSPPSFRGEPKSRSELCWRAVDVFERFAAALPAALAPGGTALVLQTSHGDEPGLVRALLGTGLAVDVFARAHFGVEIFSIYQLRHSDAHDS